MSLIQHQLRVSGTAVIYRWQGRLSDHRAVFHFLHNPRLNLEQMIDTVRKQTLELADDLVYKLVLQDTCELNYNHHNDLLRVNDPDIGLISDNHSH